jgi:hypothetical protein
MRCTALHDTIDPLVPLGARRVSQGSDGETDSDAFGDAQETLGQLDLSECAHVSSLAILQPFPEGEVFSVIKTTH